jgi:hypothetical protein
MATIPSTVLGTSDPVDLCKGFALFPAIGNPRIGISVSDSTKPLFSVSPSLLVWKLNAQASFGIRFGICGPAYGFRLNAAGSTSGQNLSLNLSNDQINCGMILGLDAGVNFIITVQQLNISWVWDGWNSHIKTSWETVVNTNIALDFDLLGTVLAVILYINDESEDKNQLLANLGTYIPNLIGSWGFYDAESDEIGDNGQLSAEPAITVPINLANFVPQLQELNKSLAVVWGGFGIGPSIGVSIPTTVSITNIQLDSATFNNVTVSNGVLTGSTTDTIPESPTTISMGVQHNPNFDFQVGFWAQFYILKILNIGFSYTFDVLELLGIRISLGKYNNTVSSTVGGGINPPPPPGGSRAEMVKPRVRLKPKAQLAV